MSSEPDTHIKSVPRYATITTGDGDTLLYDRECPDAWLQSSYLLELKP